MRIFELDAQLHKTPGYRTGGVIAIGNFDGVHLGHRAVIGQAVKLAEIIGTFAGVMTFEPYPAEFFRPDKAPPRLSSRRHKFELLSETGAEQILCMRFGQRLCSTSAEDFVADYLVDRLQVRHVLVGEDFRFGARRAGNVELLKTLGPSCNFGVTAISDFLIDGARVSSSAIRQLLADGDLAKAEQLLGRPFAWRGRVVHGDKRGRQWGFPTANLVIQRDSFAVAGVFVVGLESDDGMHGFGVANVGRRPTVDGLRLLIETNLFDFSGDLYGKMVTVTFLHRIREEKRFPDFDALKAQIGRDVEYGRRWLEESKSHA